MTDHAPMKLEKHYTCWIVRRWHIPNKYRIPRLATGLLVSNELLLEAVMRDVALGLHVVDSSSLVSVLFRKAFSIPTYFFFIYKYMVFLLFVYICLWTKKIFESYFSD